MCALVATSLSLVNAHEPSVYDALVEIETLDSIYSFKIDEESPYRLELRGSRDSRHSERRPGQFGWVDPKSTKRTKVESSGKATEQDSGSPQTGLIVEAYTGPKLKADEIPYIDKEGFRNNNYGIMLTATWCHWCRKMYKDAVEPLRAEGFKVYVIDVDEFPDIKDKIHRLDTSAEKMGRIVPCFVVRQGGKTTKMFSGYVTADTLRPHMKKPEKADDNQLYDLR